MIEGENCKESDTKPFRDRSRATPDQSEHNKNRTHEKDRFPVGRRGHVSTVVELVGAGLEELFCVCACATLPTPAPYTLRAVETDGAVP